MTDSAAQYASERAWSKSRLGDVASLITSGSRGWAQYYADEGDYFLRITNLDRQNIYMDFDDMKLVALPDKTEGSRTRLMKGDILISITADLGIIGYIQEDLDRNSYVNQHIALVRLKDDLDSKFIAYFLSSDWGNEQFQKLNDSGAKKGLNLESIRRIEIPNPPLPEQHKIASILSQWDDSLSILSKLIDAKRQQKHGLAEQLLTGKRRLPGFEGEWKETLLGNYIFEISERNKGSKIDRVLSVTNHSGFVLPQEQFSKRVASENVSNYKIVRKGQFAYNPSRINVGSLAKLDRFDIGIVSPLYVVFDCKSDLDSNYLLYWLGSPLAESRIKGSVQGSVRDSVSFGALSQFPFALPSLAEQNAISTVLSTLDSEIAALEALKAKVAEQKRGLMDALLTGRVRVNVEDAS